MLILYAEKAHLAKEFLLLNYFNKLISYIFYNHKHYQMQYLAAYTLASLSGK
jgi:hypothetical protein